MSGNTGLTGGAESVRGMCSYDSFYDCHFKALKHSQGGKQIQMGMLNFNFYLPALNFEFENCIFKEIN